MPKRHTAYELGLSTVPAKAVFLTDGSAKTVSAGSGSVILKKAAPRNLIGAGTVVGDVLQALRYLGKDGIDERVIDTLRRRLSGGDRRKLLRDMLEMPAWMHPILHRVLADPEGNAR